MNEPVTVIIPAFDEDSTVGRVVEQVKMVLVQAYIPGEVIVVDDGSVDRTSWVAKHSRARLISHRRNRGYGAALKTGIRAAQHELIVITDADGTYPVDRIPEMLGKLQNADMVVAARVSHNVDIPLLRRPAKWMLRRLAEAITGEHIPDLNSGLRGFRRQFVQQYLNILSDKFSFTTTLTVAALCDNYAVIYVPIDYCKRLGKSKIIPWHFVDFFTLIIRLSMLFNPLKVFIPTAFTVILLGIGKLVVDMVVALQRAGGLTPDFLVHKVISSSALMLLLSGLQILLIGMIADGITRKISRHASQGYKSHAAPTLDGFSAKRDNTLAKPARMDGKEEGTHD